MLFVLGVLTCALQAQVPGDVPRDHWAYEAVKDLIDKGYLEGYPDGSFLGKRNMTRYELAVLIKRIVDGFAARIEALRVSAESGARSGGVAETKPPAQVIVDNADLEKLRKLVEEFKPELAVIGARIDKVESELESLGSRIENLEGIVTDPEGAFEKVKSEVSELKKITVSGYIQARYQTVDPTKESESERAYADTFVIRRAKVKITARPTIQSTLVLQFELAKNSVGVKDSYFAYRFSGDNPRGLEFSIGQMLWPFGHEVPLSAAFREAPERVLVARRLFPGERDQGVKLQGSLSKTLKWQLGAFNGTGIEKGSFGDKNSRKDVIVNLAGSFKNLGVGLSYYDGCGVWKEFNKTFLDGVKKSRYGVDLQYYLSGLTVKAEWFKGRGVDEADSSWDQSRYIDGYYIQLTYGISRGNLLVARYSTISTDPVEPEYGRIDSWDLGIVYSLDEKSSLKLFYKVNREESTPLDNNGFVVEWIGRY